MMPLAHRIASGPVRGHRSFQASTPELPSAMVSLTPNLRRSASASAAATRGRNLTAIWQGVDVIHSQPANDNAARTSSAARETRTSLFPRRESLELDNDRLY